MLVGGAVVTGPWDPGRGRFLASDADRERVVDVLKTAFVQGLLTKDELGARAGQALASRTYGQLAAITADLAARPAASGTQSGKPAGTAPAHVGKRMNKKVAWAACAIVLPPALVAAFFTFYGGFLVMFLFTFIGAVMSSKSPAPRRPGPAPISVRH